MVDNECPLCSFILLEDGSGYVLQEDDTLILLECSAMDEFGCVSPDCVSNPLMGK